MARNFKSTRTGLRASAALVVAATALAGCNSVGSELANVSQVTNMSETFKQGYVVDEQTLALVPPGSSREQVLLALGTPTTTNTFENEVFYYISQTRQRRAQFLKPRLVDQRILAVYFDGENTVERIADYGLQDGRVFDFITRTTPTGGRDQTFLAQVLTGTIGGPSPESLLGGR
ncbi:MAG: outer membrane protein assembly factor BamE [Roseitalea porphyridii]|uniref:outer membrane protein assembly factor BamE n=1 Tax=Roseitalea porphyridii TaxID=1852022 RepID=UPI0032D9080F